MFLHIASMTRRFFFWALLLCLFFWATPALADTEAAPLQGTIYNVAAQREESTIALVEALRDADVVYLGETHDQVADHQAQLAMLQTLHSLRPNLAIGMEMFQRPYQAFLDRYLAGDLTEAQLLEGTQYKKRWGYDWELYAPILRFAKANRLPVIALNAPTEVTRKVARSGLDSLTGADWRFVPPRSAVALEPESYQQRLRQIYDEIHQGKSNSLGFERFFQAQVLWDETMAEQVARSLQKDPKRLVVVLAGQGHLFYSEGIPRRVQRRLQNQRYPVQQVVLLLNPDAETEKAAANSATSKIADYFWFFPSR